MAEDSNVMMPDGSMFMSVATPGDRLSMLCEIARRVDHPHATVSMALGCTMELALAMVLSDLVLSAMWAGDESFRDFADATARNLVGVGSVNVRMLQVLGQVAGYYVDQGQGRYIPAELTEALNVGGEQA